MTNLNYFILNQIKSNPDGGQTCDGNRQSRLMSYRGYLRNLAIIFAVLTMSIANIGTAWGDTEVTISATQSNDYSSSCYLIPDGTAISAIAGAGGNGFGNESGPNAKITVNASKKTATLTFTIKSGITITSFKVNGTSNSNVKYDLDGTSVSIGDVLTGLSKTSSMVFTLTCTETSGSSNRNTKISSIVLTYTSDAGGAGGGGGGSCYSDLAYSGGASMPTGWTIVSDDGPKPQIKNNTIAMASGNGYTYSSGTPIRGMYFDADQNATISITSFCQNNRAFCLVEKNGDSYSIIQTWDGEETLTASIVSGRRYYITSQAASSDNAKCNITAMSFSDCAASSEHWYVYGNFSDGSTWGDTEVEMDGNVDISLPLDAHDYSFKIKHVMSDGETTYYSGNNGIMSRGECTNWDMNVDENCRIRTDISGTYNFALTLNESTPRVTVTYPTGGVLVTLVLNNGGNNYSWYTRSGEPIIRPNFEPSKDGYAFDGWYADSECTEPWNWSTTVSSATTLYAKWSNAWYYAEEDDKWANHVMTRTAGASYWYREASKKAATRQFKIQRNGTWYDCRQSSPGYMCTDVTNMNNSNNDFKLDDYRAGVYKNDNDYKILVFPPNTPANSTNDPIICASTSLPEEYYSLPSGRTIYFDNSEAEWANIYFRKGRDKCAHNEATALTKVPGTANLYQYAVSSTYNGYQAFHLANNCSWTGNNSIYKVNGNGYAITKATVFQKYTINEDVTFTPGDTYGSPSDGCQYYDVDKTSGMKTQNVSITAPSNGTITVNYVDVSGAAQAFSSGNRDLAHTCIITVTAEPAAGYAEPATISINGASHGNRDPYTITGTTVVAATFSPASYTVTLNTNGGTINADNVTSYTYGTGATLPTNVTKDGFTFGGWYDNSGLTGSPVTTISTTATGNKEYWAKWTEDAGSSKCITFNSTSAPSVSGVTIKEVAGKSGGSTYTKDGFFMSQSNDYITFDISALGNLTKATFTAKTNSRGKTIGYGYTDNTTTIGEVPGGSGTADKDFHEYEITGIPGNTTRFTIIRQGTGTTITEVCLFYTAASCTSVAAPTALTCSAQTSSSLTFTWTKADHASTYTAKLYSDAECTIQVASENLGDVATVTFSELSASTTYYCKVQSHGDGSTYCADGGTTAAQNGTTDAAAAPAGDCDELFAGRATSTSVFTPSVGSATFNLTTGNSFSAGGYSCSVKPNSSNAIVASPKDGGSFAAGDSLIVVVYNNQSSSKIMGFKLGSGTYSEEVAAKKLHVFRQKLVASDISAGKVTFNRQSSEDRWVEIIIKHCGLLPSCTTPELPSLSDQEVCAGKDGTAWDATITNSGSLVSGETVAYSWVKKGGSTPVSSVATYLPTSVTEAMAGTYVVTATVSADGKASKSATKEVTLTVNEATEVTAIKADKATVYPTNSVTLTATANVTPQSWQWYTCDDAEGTNPVSIDGATSANYTIASAGSAGTYYYKVTATGSCGIAARVYTLKVSPAVGGDCFHYVSVIPTGSDIAISSNANIVTPTHATTLEGGTMKVGSSQVTITKNGLKLERAKYVSITLDAALEAGNVVIVKGSTAKAGNGVTINGVNFYESGSKTFDVSYTVAADDGLVGKTALTVTKYSGSSYLQEIKITGCGKACNDPEVTASVDNSTACVGSSVTFTATGAHAEATYQWQKYSGGAWTDIADATAATYNINPVATTDALKYRVIARHVCDRTSNEVTLNVPVAPVFNSFTATRTVMATQALSITDVEASDATSYAWYKSADDTYDAGTDTKVGTSKDLLLASGGEAAGDTYFLFCVASNACGTTTSDAITVTVTAYVEEDCATKGNEGAADFGFTKESGVGESSVSSQSCWTSGGKAKYLTYTAPEGKYFDNAKVTVAVSSGSVAAYGYSTDGSSYTYANLTGLSSTLAEKTIDLPANVTHFRIGRNFDPNYGVTSGTFYLSKICFEYSNACTATTVTPNTSSVNYTMGGDWTNPKFTLSVAGTLTYSSSDEEIASVDESGNVSFKEKAGTVTITASYAGGTISETEYCASEGSYTINVSCPGGAPKIVADGSVNMSGCNSSVILNAKTQDDTDFADGTYQWFRNGTEISGATSSSYTAIQTGVYNVAYTSAGGCTSPSINNATVTSDNVEPEVERLVPFQYYHVNKNYSAQMKDRHLFSVKGSAEYGSTGKNFKLTMSRNSEAATDITTAASIFVTKSGDGQVDTVMIDLNKLSGSKYSEGDRLVLTCAAVDCNGNVSDVYKNTITIHVIDATPTLALICSGSSKAGGTRNTEELTVGGDFLTGYNVADLCQQTGNKTFDANIEWGLYTDLKANYIVTPVNGYAVFNKLNYEPFDILLLTDYPKASKSDAAATVLDDMAALCDYRPMLSFKTHMVQKSPSKWAAKGFTTSPVVTKADGCLNLNIVCYAHPMFEDLQDGTNVYRDADNKSELVYTMLSEPGFESGKGMQGFEIAAAENFVTIGLTHYNASAEPNTPSTGEMQWRPDAGDRMLVTVAERQTNIEARFILFSINCGAQSKLTEKGEDVVLACLKYLLDDNPLHVADCSFTFDNGANAPHDKEWYKVPANCPGCTGELGDGLWSTEANWGPSRINIPGEFTSARIAAPVTVDMEHAKAMELRIIDEGKIVIPAGKALEVKSTIRRMDGSEIYPTDVNDIVIGSSAEGNGSLIFNNDKGDAKARVALYSTAKADAGLSAAASTWQYIGTPHTDVTNARSNYYGSWLYQYDTASESWVVIPNGGPLQTFRGYCVTHPSAPVVFDMSGTLAATTSADIDVPAKKYVVTANSWVAPIDINKITDDDMEGITDKTIYFFNTGSDPEGNHTITPEATGDARWAVGTYVSVPIHAASYTGTDDHIPSMQGFYVVGGTSDGTLHLDYDRHVRGQGRGTIVSGRMHAPKRVQTGDNEPEVLKIIARGSRYDDRLIVLEREDFTRRYDSGWDGEAWGGSELSPMVYITNEAGVDEAVSAIPEYEGTVITFRAGEDSEYRFEFIYSEDAEPLYLFDTENNTYTQIMTGNAYYFTTSDKAPHSRFILTRKAPQITTGTELTSDGESAKARKLLIGDKMYILLNGMLYDATGKVVK